MSEAEEDPLPIVDLSIPLCRNLRNKGMYVYTDGGGGEHGDYDNTIYWCLQTMKSFGPDDEQVDAHECRAPDRSCYEPL
jgi:hypothetical protein